MSRQGRHRCAKGLRRDRLLLSPSETSTATAPLGRVLLTVSGSLRGAPLSWHSLSTMLLHRLHLAALMLVVAEPMAVALAGAKRMGSNNASSPAAQFYELVARHAIHLVSVPEYADYGDALDLMQRTSLDDGEAKGTAAGSSIGSWRERPIVCPFASYVASPLGGVLNATCVDALNHKQAAAVAAASPSRPRQPLKSTGSAAIVGVYRWYAKRALIEYGLLDKYDWFIYTRTDLHFMCAPLFPRHGLLQQALEETRSRGGVAIVPVGEDWDGLMERFIVASRGAILPALTTLEHWVHGRDKLARNSEEQLKRSLRRACVRVLRVPRTSFVLQRTSTTLVGRRRKTRRKNFALPTFERVRSNWGSCMHAASHVDVLAFGMPNRWGLRPLPVPTELDQAGVCPKYAAAWWLANRTCSNQTFFVETWISSFSV